MAAKPLKGPANCKGWLRARDLIKPPKDLLSLLIWYQKVSSSLNDFFFKACIASTVSWWICADPCAARLTLPFKNDYPSTNIYRISLASHVLRMFARGLGSIDSLEIVAPCQCLQLFLDVGDLLGIGSTRCF